MNNKNINVKNPFLKILIILLYIIIAPIAFLIGFLGAIVKANL